MIEIPISHGELIDRITILQIKSQRMDDAGKLEHVRHELDLLQAVWARQAVARTEVADAWQRLLAVNEVLWDVEERIRLKEQAQAFDAEFICLARSVYIRNDERAALKRDINQILGSELVEEKSYRNYRV